jgi:hypothetical protein
MQNFGRKSLAKRQPGRLRRGCGITVRWKELMRFGVEEN